MIKVDLNEQKISNDDLKCLEVFPHLQEVNLSRTRITDAGLQHLTGLHELRILDLESC